MGKIQALFDLEYKITPIFANESFVSSAQKNDIIFFGNAIDFLLQCAWFDKQRDYRLWALSHAHASLIANFLNLPCETINVIPRYELFPLMNKRQRLKESIPVNLVYSGRIIEGKNVSSIVNFANLLKKIYGQDFRVHLCYPQVDENVLAATKEVAAECSIELIDHGDLGCNWVDKLDFENKAYINLSTFSSEDFSVSCAQAEQRGWPMFVSAWGCFHDLSGPNIGKIDIDTLLAKNHERKIKKEFDRLYKEHSEPPSSVESCGASYLKGEELGEKLHLGKTKYLIGKEPNRDLIRILHLRSLI